MFWTILLILARNAGHGGVKDPRQPQISQNQAVRKQKQGAP